VFSVGTPEPPEISYIDRKAANAVRTRTRSLLGVERLYDLDRLDLRVKSTLASVAQANVSAALRDLSDPESKLCRDLWSSGLLSGPDPRKVNYSFTLYERGDGANFLRVQSDNIDQPFDLNEGAKLELGSTAKLRTLVTYLEIVATLHSRYRGMTVRDLKAVIVPNGDHLTQWAIDYFLENGAPSLSEMLEAAMERTYSASPYEGFFTGGGMHTFSNFNADDNERRYTVRNAFHNSVNLVFIRLMRDIVRHTMYQTPGMSAHIFDERDDPRRRELLERFADREGRLYLDRFYKKYRGMTEEAALEKVMESVRPTPRKLSAFYRTVFPDAPFTEYLEFVRAHLPRSTMNDGEFGALYEVYSPNVMSLADRGYVAGVHPLEMWLVSYLRDHPNASRQNVLDASAGERIDVYEWLFKTSRKNAQDSKIRFMLEMEAFLEIHRMWQRLGYPFGSLVPSYATSIGSSGDRPASLSELLGIILNDGVRRPALRIREFHFAEGTPFETVMEPAVSPPEQVLAPEVAHVVRDALLGVVEQGTARRAIGAFKNEDGDVIPVGGKTGTGDNRYNVYGRWGQLIRSTAVSRVATFVFTIGDDYFGAITAYVPGEEADLYGFTSALPVEILKRLAPALEPLIAQEAAENPKG
jgi:membrane peptidoglycan carboxypeptidase